MGKKKGFRTVLATVIIMIVILTALSYVVLKYLAPVYKLNQGKLYDVAIRLFPLLIGIVLITIATMLSGNNNEDEEDENDKLPPNAYDSFLFDKPVDDPNNAKKSKEDLEKSSTPKEEVPFVSVFEEEAQEPQKIEPVSDEVSDKVSDEVSDKSGNELVDEDNEKEFMSDSLNRIEAQIEKLTASIATLLENSQKDTKIPVTIPVPVAPTEPKLKSDETAQMLYRDYEGSEAKKRAMAEYDCAVENEYDLTLALIDLPIDQVSLSLGNLGDCLDIEGKTLVIIPFEDESEAKAELVKLEGNYEIRTLVAGSNTSYEEFVNGLVD